MKDYKRGLSDKQFKKVMKECIEKVEGITDSDWQDIVDDNNLDIHRDVLRKAFQSPMGGYSIYRFLKEEDIDDRKILKELEDKRIELEKEKMKLQDQKRDYRNFLRQEARWEELKRLILEENEKIKVNPKKCDFKNMNNKRKGIACALISDLHYGTEIKTELNNFNRDIAKERLSSYVEEIINLCETENIEVLNLELLGDLISGLIHIETRIYNQEDVISQTMECAELLATEISKIGDALYEKDIKINIYLTVGNHSRVKANYKEHLDEENFEYIIKWILEHKLEKYSNIEFKINMKNPEICEMEIYNKKIVAVHGHYDNPAKAIDKLSQYLGYKVDEVHMGHFHNYQYKEGVLINGSLSGVDNFAQRKRFNNLPCQVIKVYYEEGKTITHEIVV